jgi:hypothetical protein
VPPFFAPQNGLPTPFAAAKIRLATAAKTLIFSA